MVKIMPARKPRPYLGWLKAWFRSPMTGIPSEPCVPPDWSKLQELHPEINVLKTSKKPGKQPMSAKEYRWHVRNGYSRQDSFLYLSVGMGGHSRPWDLPSCDLPPPVKRSKFEWYAGDNISRELHTEANELLKRRLAEGEKPERAWQLADDFVNKRLGRA